MSDPMAQFRAAFFEEATELADGMEATLLAMDLDAIEAEVKRRGWEFWPSRPELKSRYLFVCDPDGYDVEIIEEKSRRR